MGQCVAKPVADGDAAIVEVSSATVAAAQKAARRGRSRSSGVTDARGRNRKGARARAAAASLPTSPRRALPGAAPDALAEAASRRVAEATSASEAIAERVAAMRTAELLPRRDSGGAKAAAAQLARRKSTPAAPGVLFAALQKAIAENDYQWATRSAEVGALLAEEVQYVDLRGELAEGKQAALQSMDEGAPCAAVQERVPRLRAAARLALRRRAHRRRAHRAFPPPHPPRARAGMERLLKRISRSTRSGKNDHIKIKADGPKPAGRGVWLMVFTFRLYLMTVRIAEEYLLDKEGRITRLTRTMATPAQAKQAAAA